MSGFGFGELLVIAFIALLLFGNRLPDVMRHLGGSILEFRERKFYERRLTRRDRYEAEKQAEEFARRTDRFGRVVVIMLGVFVLAVIVAYLLRDLDLF